MNDEMNDECTTCGAEVTPKTVGDVGKMYRMYRRGLRLMIPPETILAMCNQCGEVYETDDQAKALDAMLKADFMAYAAEAVKEIVSSMKTQHNGITEADIEDVMGVYRTYLADVMSRRKEPTLTEMRLLALLQDRQAWKALHRATIGLYVDGPDSLRLKHADLPSVQEQTAIMKLVREQRAAMQAADSNEGAHACMVLEDLIGAREHHRS